MTYRSPVTSHQSPVKKTAIFFVFLLTTHYSLLTTAAQAATADDGQEMEGFSLSNFGAKNKKTWDLKGDTLKMEGEKVNLTNVKANFYGKDDNMLLLADNGTFSRAEGKVHLQDNVVVSSDSGAKIMTDTLDWMQKTQVVSTPDKVNIYKDNMRAQGVGAEAKTDLKQVNLNKDVTVVVDDKNSQTPKQIVITCDGPLDIDYQAQTAVFNKNVAVKDGESELYADKMTGYFDQKTKKIINIVAEGNVKIVRGKDVAYSERAVYNASNSKISLEGRPKLVIYSQDGMKNVF